ncbi:phenylalanine--tRNA ligase beta subunit-related protein [Temperatibacter marinus]|uniref:Phenylalanine--tRNA ligase beta subunit-related protein n=1 Tax=Temperatibacter marinus TaxID=1456591 RepID=A0AA52EHW7_9PROT|nr:phenylalanine--tRNA ligase beta subunit-related protein [Temperatibacter marinus]WND03943.1 phenylalanine--tRNA ligase beta subunit-related protein [Temperatibacter marinus]
MQILVDQKFQSLGFAVHLGAIHFPVQVTESPAGLVESLQAEAESRQAEMMGEAASSDPIIASIREAFKICGKDPSRYRPSSEALLRRVMSGKDLYFINNVVDAANLLSLGTGLPVGCYDIDQINGDITLRVGTENETYEGVGRGSINLEGLPLLADDQGPFGTPYSDSLRTSVTETTTNFLLILFGLNIEVDYLEQIADAADLIYSQYCIPEDKLAELENELEEDQLNEV